MPKQENARITPEQPKSMEKGKSLKVPEQIPQSADEKLNKEASGALTYFMGLEDEVYRQNASKNLALKSQVKAGPPTAEQQIANNQLTVLINELKASAEHLKELSFMVKDKELIKRLEKAHKSAEDLLNQLEAGSHEQSKSAKISTENQLQGRELDKKDLKKLALEQTKDLRLKITKLKLKFKKDFGVTFAQAVEETKKPLSRFKRFADSLVLTTEGKKQQEKKQETIEQINDLTKQLEEKKKDILSNSAKTGLDLDPREAETTIDDPLDKISPDTIREIITNQQEVNDLLNDLKTHVSEELDETRVHPEELPTTLKTPETNEMQEAATIQTCLENFGGDEKARQIADNIWNKINSAVGDVSEQELQEAKGTNRLDLVKAWSNVYKKYSESQIVKANEGIADIRDNQEDINYLTKKAQELSTALGLPESFNPVSEYFVIQEKPKNTEKAPAKALSKEWINETMQDVEDGAYQAWQEAADKIGENTEKAQDIFAQEVKDLTKLFRNYQKMGKNYAKYLAPRAFQTEVKKIINEKIGNPPEATIYVLLQAMAKKASNSTSEAVKMTSEAINEALNRIDSSLIPDTLKDPNPPTLPDLPRYELDDIDNKTIDDSLKESKRISQEPDLPRYELPDTLKDEPTTLRDPRKPKKPKTIRKTKTLRNSSRGRKA